ncbi:MAG TPA: tetratricopeptide repeat protein [Spirochaetia bacterium]|nr:tetratricopeptide repeat protein [Spirochaetia bacterium]
MAKHWTLAAALLCTVSLACPGQAVDLNTYYAYPWSLGFSFDNFTPYGGTQIQPSVYYGLSGIARIPLPFAPQFQAFGKVGYNSFSVLQTSADVKFQNSQFTIMPGVGWSTRFSKNFEVGADLGIGYQMLYFPDLNVLSSGSQASRTDNIIASLGAHVSLDPAYSFSIDVSPTLTYRYALQPLTQFNGLTFGIGAAVNYRFGDDPDAPKASIRSISFADVTFPPLFAAMQSYYAKNPFAKVQIKNVEKFPITDVQVSFTQAGYMDVPTKLKTIPTLEPGKTVDIPVVASFNGEVFNTNGDTPLNGEITVEYTSHNRPAKQSLPVSYTLYDRTSISWDDDRKEAAFITKADTALRNYATFIRQAVKDRTIPGYSEPVQTAMAVFYSLKELGVIYQLALTSSFAQAQANPLTVDHVHLPRETLQRKAGDCSDLTALFCAIMESVGIPTGFITVPGHIYPVFGTKVATANYKDLHPDKSMTFDVDGELWIPVEMTMVGTSDFLTAWRKGVEEWQALDSDTKDRAIFFTAKAQEVFRPVGLKEEDLGLQYGDATKIANNFRDEADKLVDTVIDSYTKVATDSNAKSDYNRLGIVCAQYGRWDQAAKALNTALALDRNYLSAEVNLGNVYFLQQNYQDALRVFQQARDSLEGDGRQATSLYAKVLLNISRSYYELEDYPNASNWYDKAASVDPSVVNTFEYIKNGQGGAGPRAAAQSGPQVLFATGED